MFLCLAVSVLKVELMVYPNVGNLSTSLLESTAASLIFLSCYNFFSNYGLVLFLKLSDESLTFPVRGFLSAYEEQDLGFVVVT